MQKLAEKDDAPVLHIFLTRASELARRKYVYYMNRRASAIRNSSSSPQGWTKSDSREPNATVGMSRDEWYTVGSSQHREARSTHDMTDGSDMSWIFHEIIDPHLGAIFYGYGFQPCPCLLVHLRLDSTDNRGFMGYSYLNWPVSHGVDLWFRSSRGPPFDRHTSNIGLFGAHFALHFIPFELGIERRDKVPWNAFTELTAGMLRQYLTDGCRCHCTIGGCSPFTWILKGDPNMSIWWDSPTTIIRLQYFYCQCGSELTVLTYKATIRYATFNRLGLSHTCCNARGLS